MKLRIALIVVIALLPAFMSVNVAAPTAVIAANQTSGPAPLAVSFDCTGSSNTSGYDSFKDLDYRILFGDGSSKTGFNVAKGPVVSHLFESSGTYTVTLELRDKDGNKTTTTTTITVSAPDTFYSGTNTVVVSGQNDFGGKPTGATEVTSDDWQSVISTHLGAGKRILFRSGETFTSHSTCALGGSGATQSMIGSFGGGKATLEGGYSLIGPMFELGRNRLTFENLDFTRDMSGGNHNHWLSTKLGMALELFTASNCTYSNFQIIVLADEGRPRFETTGTPEYEGFAFYHNEITDDDGKYQLFVAAHDLQIVGNDFAAINLENDPQHTIRTGFTRRCSIMQNTFESGYTEKNIIKLYADQNVSHGYYAYSEKINVWANVFNNATCDWVLAFGPYGWHKDNKVRQVIVDSNFIDVGGTATKGGQVAIAFMGEDMVARNNTIVKSVKGDGYFTGVAAFRRGNSPAPNPSGCEVYHNNVFCSLASINPYICEANSTHSGTLYLKNNACWTTGSGATAKEKTGSATWDNSNNFFASDPKWTSPTSVYSTADFSLQSTSSAKNYGANVHVIGSFNRHIRKLASSYPDAGAHEANVVYP